MDKESNDSFFLLEIWHNEVNYALDKEIENKHRDHSGKT